MGKAMQNPLVSVAVVTYRSADTILETLESIKAQTYPNIELIISDDCSTDATIDKCRKWVEKNKERFVRLEILTIKKNTGVSANCNRADKVCKGEWIKMIAGDDLLMPNCVQDCMTYAKKHPDVVYLFAMVMPFSDDGVNRKKVEIPFNYDFFKMSTTDQYNYLIFERNEVPAPSAFYNSLKVRQLGIKCDERIPMMDDWPKWVNLLKKGVRFHFLDEPLVMYRVEEQSISHSSTPSKAYIHSLALFYLYYQHEEFWKKDKLLAIKKYINAKKQLNDNLFWKIANRGIKAIYKKIRHEQE